MFVEKELRQRAPKPAIRHAPASSDAMQHGEERPPCFDRQWCNPRQYAICPRKEDCQARVETAHGLILSGNVTIGYQLASLLGSCGWRMQVVHTDKQAYALILQEAADIVIADIDTSNLGGMAVLVYCKQHRPSITTFALTRGTDPYLERLAHEMGGCRECIRLLEGKLQIDTRSGMLAQMLHQAAGRSIEPAAAASRWA